MISWPIARATLRERGLHPATLVTALVLALLALTRGGPESWISGLSSAWFVWFTLFLGAGLIATEVQSGHAQILLIRPLTRAAFVGGRLAGAALVLTAGTTLAWLTAQAAALARGDLHEPLARLLSLPFSLLPALAWLSLLTALSTVLPGWLNAGVLVAARIGWTLFRQLLPQLVQRADVDRVLAAIDAHFGPQAIPRAGPWAMLLWDLFLFFAGWLLAVALFRDRELARRRG